MNLHVDRHSVIRDQLKKKGAVIAFNRQFIDLLLDMTTDRDDSSLLFHGAPGSS